MNGFEMTTDINNIPISGSQKAAVLFTELGSSVTTQMLSYFSDYELKKLRQAVGKLGAYSPKKSNFAKYVITIAKQMNVKFVNHHQEIKIQSV